MTTQTPTTNNFNPDDSHTFKSLRATALTCQNYLGWLETLCMNDGVGYERARHELAPAFITHLYNLTLMFVTMELWKTTEKDQRAISVQNLLKEIDNSGDRVFLSSLRTSHVKPYKAAIEKLDYVRSKYFAHRDEDFDADEVKHSFNDLNNANELLKDLLIKLNNHFTDSELRFLPAKQSQGLCEIISLFNKALDIDSIEKHLVENKKWDKLDFMKNKNWPKLFQ